MSKNQANEKMLFFSYPPPFNNMQVLPRIWLMGGIVYAFKTTVTAEKITSSSFQVVTTPVSMSYSEWISNYSTGGWGAKHLNTRVQESGSLSDIEDPQGLAVYSIVYGEEDSIPAKKYKFIDDEPTVIEVGAFPFLLFVTLRVAA